MVDVWYSLYDRMLNRESLVKAFSKVKSAKGSAGIDGQSINDFAGSLAANIDHLLTELRGKSYQPLAVRRVEIPKPGGGVRQLGIPTAKGKCTLQQ
jgi:retron-type reverse transcriptase